MRYYDWDMDLFVKNYLVGLLEVGTMDEALEFDDSHVIEDIHPDALKSITQECHDFVLANILDLMDVDAEQAGLDFYLTRNRHGAGFWDRGLGVIGKRLTDAAHVYGSQSLVTGNDGKLHILNG